MAEAGYKLPSEFNVSCGHTYKHASPLNTIISDYASLPARVPYVRYKKMIQRLFKSRKRLTTMLFLMLPPEPKYHFTVSMVAHRHRLNPLHVSLSKPQNHKIWKPTEALTHNVAISGFYMFLPRQRTALSPIFLSVLALSTPISAPSCLGSSYYIKSIIL